jgi:hypothetical protein
MRSTPLGIPVPGLAITFPSAQFRLYSTMQRPLSDTYFEDTGTAIADRKIVSQIWAQIAERI